MKQKPLRRFVVRKYIMAVSAEDALRKDKSHLPDDVWVDEEWMRNHTSVGSSQKKVGF